MIQFDRLFIGVGEVRTVLGFVGEFESELGDILVKRREWNGFNRE